MRPAFAWMAPTVGAAALFVAVLAACGTPPANDPDGMASMSGPTLPRVRGFAEGEPILFVHTEASDAAVAQMLTDMMGSPVLHVPALAQAPAAVVSSVYVFTNGIKGTGPLGFQPDVFDNPPGTDGYRPLRALVKVTWKNEASARELRSAGDLIAAEAMGEITFERPGVVINMPMVTWPGGHR